MKKIIVFFSLLFVFSFIIASCSKTPVNAPEDTSPNVRIWGYVNNLGDAAIILSTYPDGHFVSDATVTVNGTEIPSNGIQYYKSLSSFTSGTTIVVNINSPSMGSFSCTGVMPAAGNSLFLYKENISGCSRCSADTYMRFH